MVSYMEQSPSLEDDSRSASHEISGLLLNLKVDYRVLKDLPLDPILSQSPFQSIVQTRNASVTLPVRLY